MRFSALKYGGAMDDWLDTIELVVVRCRACRHHWYRDQPDEAQLTAMYAAGRALYAGSHVDREPTRHMRQEMRRLRRLTIAPSPALLDYGSGFGRWARAAVLEGFEVCAFEPSAVRAAETSPVAFTVVHDWPLPGGRSFDAVNVEQVLEHVMDPAAVLSGIRAACRRGAVVRVTVPNIERPYEGKALWDGWPFDGSRVHTMAPFEHLHGFTAVSLRRLVERSGLRPLPATRLRSVPHLWLGNVLARVNERWARTYVLAEPL